MNGAVSHSTVSVRECEPREVAAVRALLVERYDVFRPHFPTAIWNSYRREITAIEARRHISQLLIAVDGTDLIGTVTFYPVGALDGHGWPPGVASFRLLAVTQRARGRGIGRLLVEECIERACAAGAVALGLHTAPFMATAMRLYEAMGFRRTPDDDFKAQQVYGGDDSTADVPGLAYFLDIPSEIRHVATTRSA